MNKKDLLKKISKEIIPNPKIERARFNMTLGSFIKTLERQRMTSKVLTNTKEFIGVVHGFLGYQGDLAFAPADTFMTVGELINHCEEIMNRTVIGPEGPVVITHRSPLWVACIGDSAGDAVLDVVAYKEEVKIILNTKG